MTVAIKRIVQLVPAAAGWHLARVYDDNAAIPAAGPDWMIELEAIPCFALCDVTWTGPAGEVEEYQAVLPVECNVDNLMEVHLESTTGEKIIGPEFKARLSRYPKDRPYIEIVHVATDDEERG